MEQISEEIIGELRGIPQVGEVIARILYNEGFVSVKEIVESDALPISDLKGVGDKTAALLVSKGIKTVRDLVGADLGFLSSIPGIGRKRAETLVAKAAEFEGKAAHG
jgi:Holliday junction resolvasome RuvABC DNA-binding subunit